ncbi:MAG: hypothetical protein ACJ79S_01300 [Gemmatimonadaceae bacterium]
MRDPHPSRGRLARRPGRRPTPGAGGGRRHSAAVRLPLPVLVAAVIAATASSCTRDEAPPRRDTVAVAPPVEPTAAPAPAPALAWNDSVAGPALFVAGNSPQVAQLVFPEFTDSTLTDTSTFEVGRVSGAKVELFTRAGAAGTAELASKPAVPAREEECTSWPTARLAAGRGGRPSPWTVGFLAGRATAIPLDSIETLPTADSARLAADVARLASALPNDTAPAFRGLPFTVGSVRRFSPAPGVQALVAEVSRKVNQEANPREERILLVAERDSAQPAGPWTAAYSERTADREEAVEASEVLAAVALGRARTPTLVIGREYDEGFAYALLERTGEKKWRLRWSSAYAGC